MMRFPVAPFEAAWAWIKQRMGKAEIQPRDVIICPDCNMPVDQDMQKTNLRFHGPDRILSCPWCWHVLNLGPADRDT